MAWIGIASASDLRCENVSPTYGKFTAEPFERGFGTTVGNSLRRILLSSFEGGAVTHIKLKGAEHEFTRLPGVMEDVTDIMLNVKSLIVKLDADQHQGAALEKKRRPDHRRRHARPTTRSRSSTRTRSSRR